MGDLGANGCLRASRMHVGERCSQTRQEDGPNTIPWMGASPQQYPKTHTFLSNVAWGTPLHAATSPGGGSGAPDATEEKPREAITSLRSIRKSDTVSFIKTTPLNT